MNISIKRIYDPQEAEDGDRVLVDRIWPRGISKGLPSTVRFLMNARLFLWQA